MALRVSRCRWLIVLLGMLAALCARACGPEDALRYRDPTVEYLERQQQAIGIYIHALHNNTKAIFTATSLSNRLGYTVDYLFFLDLEEIGDTELELAEVRLELAQRRREGVYHALLAYTDVWEDEIKHRAACTKNALVRLTGADLQAKAATGEAAPLDLEVQAIDAEEAALMLEQAVYRLELSRERARRYGLRGEAIPAEIAFVLPAVLPEKLTSVQETTAELDYANTELRRHRQLTRPQLILETALISETEMLIRYTTLGPTFSMFIGAPSLQDPETLVFGGGWNFDVRLAFPLNPTGGAEVNADRARIARLQAELALRKSEGRGKAERALQQAMQDWKSVTIARERHALAERRHRAIEARYAAGTISRLDVLRDTLKLLDAEAEWAQAWKQYVKAASAYLDLVDGAWQAAPDDEE